MKDAWNKLMQNPRKLLNRLPAFLRNRYAYTLAVFAMWMLFFDHNDMVTQFQLRSELHQLEAEKAYYEEKLEEAKADLEELKSNDSKLEKFAREKYFMKKENEDIFVIVPAED